MRSNLGLRHCLSLQKVRITRVTAPGDLTDTVSPVSDTGHNHGVCRSPPHRCQGLLHHSPHTFPGLRPTEYMQNTAFPHPAAVMLYFCNNKKEKKIDTFTDLIDNGRSPSCQHEVELRRSTGVVGGTASRVLIDLLSGNDHSPTAQSRLGLGSTGARPDGSRRRAYRGQGDTK